MDDNAWQCALCKVPNSPTLQECRNCKTPRTLTTEKLAEKNAAVESRAIYVFQLVVLVFTVSLARVATSSIWIGASIVFFGWWIVLAYFASEPWAGEFRQERRFFHQLIDAQPSRLRGWIIQAFYGGLYWPIFISKGSYRYVTVVAFVIYVGFAIFRA